MSIAFQRPVIIGITTFRRPELLGRLLDVVQEHVQLNCLSMEISVLVVDNDPDESARDVVELRHGVRYVAESTPGIAAARQRALNEVLPNSLMVCLDDDVLPTGDWLVPLVSAWEVHSATIVVGFVRYLYPPDTDAWVVEGGFMRRHAFPTGTVLAAAEAGNILVDVEKVRRFGVSFDPTLGFSGGEDTLFSKQVARAGGTIVSCQESVVLGHVPVERTTREFCMKRARSHGSAAVLVKLRMASTHIGRALVRFQAMTGGAVRMVGGVCHSLLGRFMSAPGQVGNGVRIASRGFGMVSASIGSLTNEYNR